LRVRLERSAAAVSLAVHLYRADHGGAWPASLDALAPRYLPAVPRDVYASGEPLRYRILAHVLPDGGDRPIVYSIGPDGVDDTAAAGDMATTAPANARRGSSAILNEPQYGWNYHRDDKGYQTFDLSRWSPLAPPSPPPAATTPSADE
jgi:hypothetical protein